MWRLVIFFIVFLAAVPLLFYFMDVAFAPETPEFSEAPGIFCETRYNGITLPPFGIFLCPERYESEALRAHELVHWDQYERHGSFGFYFRYLWGMIESGFSYENHPMEIEARERSGEFISE